MHSAGTETFGPNSGTPGVHSGCGNPDTTAVVVMARRLPTARAGGAYRDLRAHELAAAVIKDIVAAAGIEAGNVVDVILGNATGGGGNVARLAALTAGLPQHVPGLTVDRQCGSGLEAVILACNLVRAGAGDLFLAGGVESISTAPARAHRLPGGSLDFFDRAQFAPLESGDPDAGTAAENVAARYGISRERQDSYALQSHRKAAGAAAAGRFHGELLPFAGLKADQGPRANLSPALMARFPAAFVPGGTVTAGNSCPFSDGASVALVTSLTRARRMAASGWGATGMPGAGTALAFRGSAVAGNDPNLLGVGAAHAMQVLMAANRLPVERVRQGLIEFNEAFASQVLAVADLLELDPAQFNLDGGALALGHPYGASGAILVTRLLAQVRRQAPAADTAGAGPGADGADGDADGVDGADGDAGCHAGTDAFAMLSIAGGMGIAAHFQAVRLQP